MKNAIGMRFAPYDGDEHGRSYFFGDPIVPADMVEGIPDEILFLGMIYLPEIAEFDKENKLPHEGYLYFFLDTSATSRQLRPIVRHTLQEPTHLIDDFNESFEEEYPGVTLKRGIEFFLTEEAADDCKLLGKPCDWNYPKPPKAPLLVTISHYDEGLDFLPQLDGYTYFFFGPEGHEFDQVSAFYEYA